MRTKIEVTQKHIDEGDRNRVGSNPIVLALRDALGQLWYVDYRDSYRLPTTRMEGKQFYKNSWKLGNFLLDFTHGNPVQPCTLILTDETLSMEGETE